jgi:RIO kinase 2
MVDNNGNVTLIDFPQMVSTTHVNAAELFARDINGLVKFFAMKMKFVPSEDMLIKLEDILIDDIQRLDVDIQASGFSREDNDVITEFIHSKNNNTNDDQSEEEEVAGEEENEDGILQIKNESISVQEEHINMSTYVNGNNQLEGEIEVIGNDLGRNQKLYLDDNGEDNNNNNNDDDDDDEEDDISELNDEYGEVQGRTYNNYINNNIISSENYNHNSFEIRNKIKR